MFKQHPLGNNGPLVGYPGNGAMVLEGYSGASDDETAVRALMQTMGLGMMNDSADAFGAGHNEPLVARTIKAAGKMPFVVTRTGIVFGAIDIHLEPGILDKINEIASPGVTSGATLV